MEMHLNRFVILLLVAVLFGACNSKVFYDESQSVDEDGWSAGDPLYFKVEITDTCQYYDIFVDVRNTVSYPYSNTFFFITTTFPDNTYAADTLECPLADQLGEWYGKSSGHYVDNRFYFRRKTRFPMAGTYRFKITHGMRDKSISGLKDVGLRMEYAGNE